LNCKSCGTADIRRFNVICQQGTSVVQIKAESTPKWNTKPFSPTGKQKITGTQTIQTELSKRCSPPSSPDSFVTFLSAFPGFLIGIYAAFKVGFFANSFWIGVIVFFLTVFGVLFGCHKMWLRFFGGHASVAAYKKDLNKWHRSWLCSRCGAVSIE